jgi:molybdenum cofactor cytidylyltransferase
VAVLVDEPRWPAHGRLWAHLVSDTSLAELHAFARANGVPPRSFDNDHYDVPEALVPDLVAAGAQAVGSRELLTRLVAGGLRVRQRDKRPKPPRPEPAGAAGLLLAAGAGTRFGGPKALARDADGTPWLAQRVRALTDAGCDPVLVVLGAGAEQARSLLPPGARAVAAEDWAQGMSASLRAGLRAATQLEPAPAALVVALVDLPGLGSAVVRRLLEAPGVPLAGTAGAGVLARATYRGRPGHPVLLGRAHWAGAAAAATGDRGAGSYLAAAGALLVEASDLTDGRDVDTRAPAAPPVPAPPQPG